MPHGRAWILQKVASQVLLTATLLTIAGTGTLTYAQCTSSSNIADESSAGMFRSHSTSTQQNCSGRTVYVQAWIANLAFTCSGSSDSEGKCYGESSEGNAGATVYAPGSGVAEGYSTHWYTEGGVRMDLPNRTINLRTPRTAEEECTDSGGYWYDNACHDKPASTPIVISTSKESKYKMTSAEDGVLFDIDGDGALDRIAWTEAESDVAFLALDRDGDGQITSGRELLGSATRPDAANGFLALISEVQETSGAVRASVSSEDPLFAKLLLWTDRNHNGVSDFGELRPASEVLSDIGLAYQPHNRRDGHGNLFRWRGWVHIRTAPGRNKAVEKAEQDGRRRPIYDVVLVVAQ